MTHSSVFRAGIVIAALGLVLGACSSDDNSNPDSGVADAGHTDSGTPDSGTPDSGTPDAGPTHYDLTILHTNDLHSYVNSQGPVLDYTPLTADDDDTIGGFARLSARIQAERTAAGDEPVLLLDSGDFMMGTPFQALAFQDAPELTEMGKMGYDAITFGNHEFDFTPFGLAGTLQAAVGNGFNVPLVSSNIVFSTSDSGDDDLEAFQTGAGGAPKLIVPKLVKTLSNGLKVGIFGLLGKDAVSVAPLAAPITFADQTATATAMVNELRNTDKVDLVILLSHSGSKPDGTGEDVDLAKAVSGIDVIISGHTHDAIPQPLHPTGTNTLIVQTGAYGSNLGEMKLTYTKGGDSPGVALDSYQLIPLDDSVAGDSATQTRIDGYVADLDQSLSEVGLSYAGVIGETSFDIPDVQFQESPIGDLVTDAYLNTVRGIEAGNSAPLADFAIEAGGNIRTSILKGTTGKITFADLFQVTPLGIGADQLPGYPLVTFYLNGEDIKHGLEVGAAAQSFLNNDDYFLQFSGLSFTFDSSANPTRRVVSATIGGHDVDFSDTSTCYQVVATEYVASLLGLAVTVNPQLPVTPKEADCSTVITNADWSSHEVELGPDNILHQWMAVVGYVGQFPDTNSNEIPDVPSVYSTTQGRITIQ